jgi:3-oxoadipate enol-lactonase
VLDALGLQRAVLMGQSMAGPALLRVALRHRERVTALVLINPVGLVPLRFMPLLRLLPRPVMVALGRRLVPRWVASFVLRYIAYGDPALASERDVDEYWAGTQVPGFAYSARTTLTEFDWRPLPAAEVAPLAVPTMVMLGASDRLIANTAEAAKRLPGALVQVLPGGHCVHEENAGAAYPLIGDFIVEYGGPIGGTVS